MSVHTVTGAFGYSGKYIAELLLKSDIGVQTLTNSPNRENLFRGRVTALPYSFDDVEKLARSLEGTDVLYNTYWVRFNSATSSHQEAVRNTITLFKAAKLARVPRIVHVSITNPSEKSRLEYFRGKAELERALIDSGLSYAILRPAVFFGNEDILVNNIAWALRKLPVFGVFGDGQYRLQPIHVEDFARLAIKHGQNKSNEIVNAIGPETFSYIELVRTLGNGIGIKPRIFSVPPSVGYIASRIIGAFVNDVFVTREEIEGLMGNLLYVDDKPVGDIRLSTWAAEHAETLGQRYSSELARRRDRTKAY